MSDGLSSQLTGAPAEPNHELELLRAELAQVRQAHAEVLDFFENGSLGLHCVDGEGIIRRVNHAELEMLGYSREEYIGRHIREFHIDDEVISDILDRLAADETLRDYPARLRCRDGSVREVLINSNVLFQDGEFLHTRCFTRDVTELNRIKRALAQSQKLEGLGTLAGGVAHDFNNLLVPILSNAEWLLGNFETTDPLHAPVSEIRNAAMTSAGICRQLLTYAGCSQAGTASISLNAAVREVERLLRISLPVEVQQTLELAPNLPSVCADVVQLQQVVMNVVTNAGQAASEGGRRVCIRTRVSTRAEAAGPGSFPAPRPRVNSFVCLEVEDTGPGIEVSDIDRIFDPFFTTREKGHGLGLTVVLGIVSAHGGSVLVDSAPGKTVVRVFFPATNASPGTDVKTDALEAHGSVLFIDDEPSVRLSAQRVLNKAFKVHTAASGQEALLFLAENAATIDCICLDFRMPDIPGDVVFRELRKLRPKLPIVVCSGCAESEVRRALPDECFPFLPKPFTQRTLQAALGAAVRESCSSE